MASKSSELIKLTKNEIARYEAVKKSTFDKLLREHGENLARLAIKASEEQNVMLCNCQDVPSVDVSMMECIRHLFILSPERKAGGSYEERVERFIKRVFDEEFCNRQD